MAEQQAIVNVSNISNEATEEEIKEYLSLVGPVKSYHPNKNGCKLSARVCYYDLETAMMAVNFLGQTDFRGRELKINLVDCERNNKAMRQPIDQQIYDDIVRLAPQERQKLIQLVSKYARAEPEFVEFLTHHERIEQGLRGITGLKRQAAHNNHYGNSM